MTRRKLLFMHIAKTAGTSVNSHFGSQYPPDLVAKHVESNRSWLEQSASAKKMGYVSGHLSFDQFAERLDLSEYVKVTLVREPFSHLRSHLAWIKHLSEPENAEWLDKHPEFVKPLSKKLWKTDFTSPAELAEFVRSLQGQEFQLLDNCQTRYFARNPERKLEIRDFHTALETLKQFDLIGLTHQTRQFIDRVSELMNIERPEVEVRHRVSHSYYALDYGKNI